MSDYSEYKQLFLEELSEQIDEMEEELLRLERQGAHEEGMKRLFRVAHTIKGSSAAMGYEALTELTHEWEHVLDVLRKGEKAMTRELTHLFFECLDVIKQMQALIINGMLLSGSIGAGVIDRLRSSMGKDKGNQSHTQQSLGEWPIEAFAALRDSGSNGACWAEITLSPDCLMKAARISVIDAKLRTVGEILWSEPQVDQWGENSEDEPIDRIRWLIAPGPSEGQIRELLEMQLEVASIELGQAPTVPALFEALDTQSGAVEWAAAPDELQPVADKRASGQTIRVNVGRLEEVMNLLGELVIDQTRMRQASRTLKQQYGSSESIDDLAELTDHLARLIGALQENVMKVRMLPIEQLMNRFPRMVRDLSLTLGKDVELQIEGGDTELDRTLIEEIGDPLIHLLRNAIDHGIEDPERRIAAGKPGKGIVKIRAAHEDNQVVITISDDGAGINPDKVRSEAVRKGLITQEEAGLLDEYKSLRLIFQPGFSTAAEVSEVSGRGVGMDIVRTDIERLNGRIDIDTKIGRGTVFTIRLPLTLAITMGLLVKAYDQQFVLPMSAVIEIVRVNLSELKMVKGSPVLAIRNQLIPLIWLHDLFGYPRDTEHAGMVPVVVIASAEQRLAVCVDELLGNHEVVIKTMGSYVGKVPCISGATILGNGKIALILETGGIVRKANAGH